MHKKSDSNYNYRLPIDHGKSKHSKIGKMITDYADTAIQIYIIVIVAELLKRIFFIAHEFFGYKNYYGVDGVALFWQIAKRCLFSANIATITFLILFGFGIVIRFAMTTKFYFPPAKWLAFMPLYWIFIACSLNSSNLDYSNWIREPHGLDYAEGMASNYFHGYLKLVLPSHTGHPGLKERIELYEAKESVQFAAKRLFILVPNTMFVNNKIESKILTKDGVAPLETVVKMRAGVERPFKNDVYKFTELINGNTYYIALEGATPLLSFFDSMAHSASTTWQMKEMKREILLKFYKHLKKLLQEWPPTQDTVELILYNAQRNDGRPQDVGEVIQSHVLNMIKEGRT